LTIDDVLIPTFGEPIDDRGELVILTPHPEAEGIDHAFQSLTYKNSIKDVIEIYKRYNGELSPDQKGNLK
jgi:hypothetical protein